MNILKKIGKVFLYIVAGLVALLFVAGLFIDPIAKNLLEKQVSNAAEGQYSLALDDVDISILGGDAKLLGVKLDTDTIHSDTPPIVFFKADKVAVQGLGWLRFLVNSKLELNKVILDNIEIEVFARTIEDPQDTSSAQQPPFRLKQLDIYPAIKEQVDRVRLKDLTLNEISITLINVGTQDSLAIGASELNLASDDILIDADKLITDNRAFYATEIDFEAKDLVVRRSGDLFIDAEVRAFNFLTEEELLGIQVEEFVLLQKNSEHSDTSMFVDFAVFELTDLDMKKIQDDSIGSLKKIGLSDLTFINKQTGAGDGRIAGDTTQMDQSQKIGELSMGESLPELMKQLRLNELDIKRVSIRQGDSIRVENAGVHASNIVIDEKSAFAGGRFLHAGTMESHVDLISATTGPDKLSINISDFALKMDGGTGRTGFTKLFISTEEKTDKEMWFEAELGPFEIVNLDTRNLSHQELNIDSIGLLNPVLLVNLPEQMPQSQQEGQKQANQGQAASAFNLYPSVEDLLDRISIRKLAVTGADIEVSGMGKTEKPLKIPALYLQFRDMLIAEGTAFENNRILHAEDIAFRSEGFVFPVDEVYTLEADLARFSTFEQFFELRGMKYGYGQNAEAKFQKHGTNQLMNISNRVFRINRLDFQRLLQKQEFFASSARAEGFELFAYNNENYPPGGTEAEKEAVEEAEKVAETMPQTRLKEIEVPFFLKSFDLNSGKIKYKQMAPEADTAGVMEITDFFVNIRNLTNVRKNFTQNPEIEMKTGGKIMGSGAFELMVDLNMVSESNEVDVRGKLDTLNVTELNEFTEYISRLGFESGEIYEVNWKIDANEEKAEGTLEMSYNDLDIRISESNNPDDSGILKEAGTFLANNLVLESEVAEKSSEEPEKTEISEERGEDEPFPAYILKSLVWGFVDIMVTIF